jgi:hypothetical protein
MTTTCQRCARKCQLFLCQACTTDLRDMLLGLAQGPELNGKRAAGWIEYLEDAALGRTRLGESARRSTERNTPLPVNLGASKLLGNVHAMLARWVQDICESRGVEIPK